MKTLRLLLLWLVLAASYAAVTPALAQNLRQLTRATATTGVNDSALVLVSDSASRTRAALTLDLFRRPSGSATAPANSFTLSTGLGSYRFGADTLGWASGGVGRMRLSATGLHPITDNAISLGTSVFRWSDVRSNTATFSGAIAVGSCTGCGGGATVSDTVRAVTFDSVRATRLIPIDSVRFNGTAASIRGGAGNMTIVAGTGANRELSLQATDNGSNVCTVIGVIVIGVFSRTTIGSGCTGTDSLLFAGGTTAIRGGAGNMNIRAGTGNSRTLTLQATSSAGAANTFAIGASDTLKGPGKVIFSALTAASGTPNSVCIDATSKQITENAATSCVVSSLRFKRDVAPLNPVTAKRIAARLRPVTYNYKDGGREAIGLIAEDAAIADGRLVSRDAQGRPHSVNYEQVTILLLSIVQQQQKQIDSMPRVRFHGASSGFYRPEGDQWRVAIAGADLGPVMPWALLVFMAGFAGGVAAHRRRTTRSARA